MSEAVRYAGFWRRAGAHLIDSLIYVPLSLLVLYGIYGPDYFATMDGEPGTHGFWDIMFNDVVPLVLVIWLWRRFGATPGKRLMHCRVVDAQTYGPLSWGQAALRSIAYIASIVPLGLGFFWILWDKRHQGFHDMIANTIVIYAPEDEGQKSIDQLERESR